MSRADNLKEVQAHLAFPCHELQLHHRKQFRLPGLFVTFAMSSWRFTLVQFAGTSMRPKSRAIASSEVSPCGPQELHAFQIAGLALGSTVVLHHGMEPPLLMLLPSCLQEP